MSDGFVTQMKFIHITDINLTKAGVSLNGSVTSILLYACLEDIAR